MTEVLMFVVLAGVLGLVYLVYAAVLAFGFPGGTRFYVLFVLLALPCVLAVGAQIAGVNILAGVLGVFDVLLFGVIVVSFVYLATGARLSKEPETIDWIVVLGCLVRNGKPGTLLMRRLDLARECLARHAEARVMLCGGKGPDETVAEAKVMRDYLIEQGIAEEVLYVEDGSTTTAENFGEFMRIVQNPHANVCVITSDFHVRRVLRIARRTGFTRCFCLPCKTDLARWPVNALRESCALVADVLNIDAHDIHFAGQRW